MLGRFGWQAQLPTIKDFVRAACGGELGLTVPVDLGFGVSSDVDAVPDPEMSWKQVDDLTFYCRELGAPLRGEKQFEPEVLRGEALFKSVGCSACHVPELYSPYGSVRAYTDLLLHDVARRDGSPHAEIGGGETVRFRTPPLWGIRETPPYLHDGRALTLPDAIAAHGGEAERVRKRFEALYEMDRKAILAFLLDL